MIKFYFVADVSKEYKVFSYRNNFHSSKCEKYLHRIDIDI